MKALLLTEYRRLELVDLPQPEIGAEDVLMRVAACGICGSDVHGYDGSTGRRIPPLVMGHEAAGIVEAIGAGVTRFQPGDRVTFDSTIYCGECEYCRAGRNNLCDRREVLGVSCGDYRRYGAFAEFVAVPEQIMYPLPETVPLEHAALIEAVSVAVHAVSLAPLTARRRRHRHRQRHDRPAGDPSASQCRLRTRSWPSTSTTIGSNSPKRLGADLTINAAEGDADAKILAATGGRGAAAALEVVGTTATIGTAIRCVRKGGAVTLVGNVSPKAEIPLQMVVNREIVLRGSCASNGEYPQCIDLLARGAIDVRPLISACIPLDDAPQWFERLYAREPGLMKVVVLP